MIVYPWLSSGSSIPGLSHLALDFKIAKHFGFEIISPANWLARAF
jgi:hypothetical protein